MPTFGGYSPYPRRFGGGGKPRLQRIHESLNAQRGTAYDAQNSQTFVWVENMAIARAISAAWSTNQRLANQADPLRMTDHLARWEKILQIPVPPDATDADRRAEVFERLSRIGKASLHARIYFEASRVLGDFFAAVEYIDPSIAVVHVPDASYPWGTVVPGVPWYSTVAHVLIKVNQPAGYTLADFWAAVGRLAPVMDHLLPIEVTWDFYVCPSVGVHVNVPGGPSCAGFYLDEPDLDLEVFDV